MGMYSYFVMAEPFDFKFKISEIPAHLYDYFFPQFDKKEIESGNLEMTLKEFGESHDRIKFLSYLTLENGNRWKQLFQNFQKQASEQGIDEEINLHYLYEDTQMFFIQAKTSGSVNIFVGEPACSKYFVLGELVQKLLKYEPDLVTDFFDRNGIEITEIEKEKEDEEERVDNETLYLYIPAYLQTIEDSSGNSTYSHFKAVDFRKLQPDPVHLLFSSF